MTIIIIILLVLAIIIGLANFFKKTDNGAVRELRSDLTQQLGQNRQEISGTVQQLNNNLHGFSTDLTERINDKFDRQFKDLQTSNEQKLDKVNEELKHLTDELNAKFDSKFLSLQESNDKKLTAIQNTVDEKLQETLNKRISQSFEQVTTLLTSVDKGLGEMRNLASDVDSLQKVMTGVKTRGIVGEIQLGRILEQIFTQSQYREQVNIQGNNAVDYAVVMPGKAEGELLLPIDSKFPLEDYQRLQSALELADTAKVDSARKALFTAIKTQAKSISEKYILPPKTTDFAIMFLPTEGLFMEVVNNPELYEQLSRDYKVNVTGPTTMTAVLNSLQMGFKTLQIEQKSSEVYEMLGAVKTEFGKFEKSLTKVHERLQQSEKEINSLITTRTKVMSRKLQAIDAIDDVKASSLLELENED
ncbi:DNA recombination protein RmuC [Lactococcus termiticola]|uniref:DNA recombination protein RmuC n=1 Tax=Lactococcus termiticola TaxID=2169526 RepID=A0A2R5HDY4_9LACT|nr:DNA recombination protein RmuC [Lactococcus termiticola]GBG96269.1 hypothetical protein NtB2_00380 [Lactococcus termiticola]